ncbi:MAG TPA: pseudouridine synthase [Candidatus Ozemobacteraceae bacterium]|nr:pseudouridine synthase [Candidatus Ozemobacteraceae bacterium]
MDHTRFSIVFLDEWYVAIEKPVDWLIHHSPTAPRSQPAVVPVLEAQLGRKVFPVHRLDRATSGLLLFALSSEAAAAVAMQFEQRQITKTYLAVVRGWFAPPAGSIERPLSPMPGENQQEARTCYETVAQCELPVPIPPHQTCRYSLMRVFPETGRRQQIRRHFAGAAHPIIGDGHHGDRRHNQFFAERFGCRRMLLMAARLKFYHIWLKRFLELQCHLDEPVQALLSDLFPGSMGDEPSQGEREP